MNIIIVDIVYINSIQYLLFLFLYFNMKHFWQKYVLINTELSITKDEVREKYIKQRENRDWTLYSERTFIEQLFSTRFNYFVASFSLLTAAVSNTESNIVLFIILLLSSIILTLMSLAIYRIYIKLIIILKLIYMLEDYQVFKMVDNEIEFMNNRLSVPVNAIIGVIIPFVGCTFFWIYLLVVIVKYFFE